MLSIRKTDITEIIVIILMRLHMPRKPEIAMYPMALNKNAFVAYKLKCAQFDKYKD